MIGHLKNFMPSTWSALESLKSDLSNLGEIYPKLESISIDYAIAEKVKQQVCVPVDCGWSDVGSWDEIAKVRESEKENVISVESQDCFVFPQGTGSRTYALVGVKDLIVVDTADCLLISKKGETQKVKNVVDALEKAGRSEAKMHVFEHRPWGKFEILRDTQQFKSKVITVEPGHQLSYQSHAKRAEHWVMISGAPEVVLNDEVLKPKAGESVFIPMGAKHRIRNPGKEPVVFVEVQVGTYFGEDDIVRYQDDYSRS